MGVEPTAVCKGSPTEPWPFPGHVGHQKSRVCGACCIQTGPSLDKPQGTEDVTGGGSRPMGAPCLPQMLLLPHGGAASPSSASSIFPYAFLRPQRNGPQIAAPPQSGSASLRFPSGAELELQGRLRRACSQYCLGATGTRGSAGVRSQPALKSQSPGDFSSRASRICRRCPSSRKTFQQQTSWNGKGNSGFQSTRRQKSSG